MTTRLVASTIIHIIIIIALLYFSMLTTGQWLNIDLITILPILLLTLVSMYGVGFIIAGISILFKQVEAFLQILQFILAGLTFVPLSVAPFMAYLPIVKGVDLIRSVMIDHVVLGQINGTDFGILIFNSMIYFVIGLAFFLLCERIAMKKGLLAHY